MINCVIFWRTLIQLKHMVIVILFFSMSLHASLDNKGTSFIIAFLPQYSTPNIELHLTGDLATDVTISYPMNSPTFTQVASIIPGQVTIVELPISTSTTWVADQIQDTLISATADEEFVTYLVNRSRATSDAALALPIDTMNLEYLVADYNALFKGEFTVYAAFDNTTVTITPKNPIIGHPVGVPFQVTLNKGQGYHAQSQSSGVSGSLMGTKIVADRPVGLINGNLCTYIPNGVSACDHIFEVAQPVVSWGLTAAAANLPNRPSGSIYRVMASTDNTTVRNNGVVIGVINTGEFIEIPPTPGNQFFSADQPIFVTQYMTGQSSPGATTGDPAMANIIPSAQYHTHYTFSTVGGFQFSQNFVTIIADNADVGLMTLDGAVIPLMEFTPIPGQPLSAAVIALQDGPHTTASVHPHGITVEGYNNYDSYIYPGGALFQFINPRGDEFNPVCTVSISPDRTFASGYVTDNLPSEDANNNGILDPGEDSNNNGVIDKDTGVFFVETSNNVNALVNIDAFIPGDPNTSYTVHLIDPQQTGSVTITGTDGAGNQCISVLGLQSTTQSPLMCDLDQDLDVDRNDLAIIQMARNSVVPPNDPRDIDKDGIVTMNDARKCVAKCTLVRCAILPPL
ncbi:MAG: IgGFc-binding protein [Aliivibrio sp.]|uniref:IgGFc-binding protein n=1 Tax=Aliivibrio sp. TaxID=1872443 RepID=UPI001A434148|nr:IgGFc-binding protein [Aliivibrio sp.]